MNPQQATILYNDQLGLYEVTIVASEAKSEYWEPTWAAAVNRLKSAKKSAKRIPVKNFPVFWEAYPQKVAKKKCLEIWKRHRLDPLIDDIMQGIRNHEQTDRWKEGFIVNPSTFLNQRRWEDEINVKPSQLPKTSRIDRIRQAGGASAIFPVDGEPTTIDLLEWVYSDKAYCGQPGFAHIKTGDVVPLSNYKERE